MQKGFHLYKEQNGAIPTAGNNAAVLPSWGHWKKASQEDIDEMSLLVLTPLTPQKTVLSQSGEACSVQLSRGSNTTASDKEMREFNSTTEKKKNNNLKKDYLPSFSQSVVNKSSYTILNNSKITPKCFLYWLTKKHFIPLRQSKSPLHGTGQLFKSSQLAYWTGLEMKEEISHFCVQLKWEEGFGELKWNLVVTESNSL